MGLEQNLPLTKHFLWQELLLRRIKDLELDKEKLVEQIEQLEESVTQASAHRMLTDKLLVLLARAIRAIRILPEQVETETTFTEQLTIQAQQKMLIHIEKLSQESIQLNELMSETIEGIHAISEQVQTCNTLFLQDAYLYQEKMTADLNNLYDEDGNLQVAFSEAGQVIQRVRELAQAKQKQLKQNAFTQRETIMQQLDMVQEQNQQLQIVLHRATQAANAICYWLDGRRG